jgi:mono/diheme cytochrome c family protein
MKKILIITGILLVLAAILAACGGEATPTEAPVATEAEVAPTDAPTAAPEVTGDSLRGGKLYDIWFEELGIDAPQDINPLWTASSAGDVTAGDSYRCAVCHGFDYNGANGFVGIAEAADLDPNEILAILKGSTNPDHDFSQFMDDQALADLALFVNEEQVDVNALVSMTGKAGDGKILFNDNCILCHGAEGMGINFQNDAKPEYPASIAKESPLELLSKLRFGQPAILRMPSGIDNNWTDQNYADAIAYIRTLPAASPTTEGGRMYDNWIEALGATAPETDQPLWKTQTVNTTISGADTWLCSTCHGLDYKGRDGINAEGTESYTGFPGILAAKDMSETDLTAWLDGTKNKDHDFKSYFTADEMARMVAFMQKGMADHSDYINADGKAKGDVQHGKVLFTSICQICHGENGKTINFLADEGGNEYIGNVATAEPWGFFHVATVGVPGTGMPAGMNLGWLPQDIADLLAYAQTMQTK